MFVHLVKFIRILILLTNSSSSTILVDTTCLPNDTNLLRFINHNDIILSSNHSFSNFEGNVEIFKNDIWLSLTNIDYHELLIICSYFGFKYGSLKNNYKIMKTRAIISCPETVDELKSCEIYQE